MSKDTHIIFRASVVGKSSQLAQALADGNRSLAGKIHDATTARFDALYPGAKQDRLWFESWGEGEKKCPSIDRGLAQKVLQAS